LIRGGDGNGTIDVVAARMNPKAEALKARTKRFALDIIQFVNALPKTPATDVMGRQLLKAGTSVAANYRSACRSRSHAEFTARIGVVLEEADESELWLELLDGGPARGSDGAGSPDSGKPRVTVTAILQFCNPVTHTGH
jgi:four helix bundle protein